jgi:O-antigen ligase
VASLIETNRRFFVLPVLLGVVDLAFQKGAQDPLNPIKLLIAGILGLWLLSDLLVNKSVLNRNHRGLVTKVYLGLNLFFLLFLTLAALHTEIKSIGLLGDTGRNSGLLNYLILVLLALYMYIRVNLFNIRSLYYGAFLLAFIFGIYGALQHFKLDFLKWKTPYNQIILTIGNPDFASSLLSIFAILCFAGFLAGFFGKLKFILLALSTAVGVEIFWTHALQGLVNLIVGLGILSSIYVWQKSRTLGIASFAVGSVLAALALFGSLRIGPLSKYLYKASVTDRGYDWKAAVEMSKSHPLLGVGVDRFGSFFPQYKDVSYVKLYGYDQTVTNAHNVFLQLFATAGFFVGITYLFLMVFIGWRSLVALQKYIGTEQILVAGLVAAWVAYLLQSIISPETLSISVWGWALSGAIVALSINTEFLSSASFNAPSKDQKQLSKSDLHYRRGIIFSLLFIAFMFLVVPIERNETSTYRLASSKVSSDPQAVENFKKLSSDTINSGLINPNYQAVIALAMGRNNFGPETVLYMKRTILSDPRNLLPYSYLAKYYEYFKNPQEAIAYRKSLAKYDPWNAPNLVQLESDYLAVGDKSSAKATEDIVLKMVPGTPEALKAKSLFLK